MDMPSGSLNTESPLIRGRTEVAALFDSRSNAEAAVQSLAAAGFLESEIRSEQKGDEYLVTVTRQDRLQEAAVILQQQGGSLPDGDSTSYEKTADAIEADAKPAPDTAVPPDSGLSERGGKKQVGGGVFTRSSGTGGSGSGTATGGSLFGSGR